MKKFLHEYKANKGLRSKSDSETSKARERVTVTTHEVIPATEEHTRSATQVGTIRTEEYKRDLAEFQARRSTGSKELPDTPVKKKCGRHSLPLSCTMPVSCTDCATGHDNTFNYEQKSAAKYKKKNHKRAKSAAPDAAGREGLPSIQFLFQNQVFMPGNVFASYSEPQKSRRHARRHRSPDFAVQKHIDFSEDQTDSPPLFYKNNSLPYDVKNFLEGEKSDIDLKQSSLSSSEEVKADEDKLWEVMSELRNFDEWADEQLQGQNTSKSDDSKSDTSAYGLPIASACNLDVNVEKEKPWSYGTWGVVPVQVKKLTGVSIEHVKRKLNTEINILRKFRHPNIILLMGLYPDIHNNVHLICERCIDSLYGILHVKGNILSAQNAVHYALDVANALLFLRMQGFVHTELTSHSIMVTGHDAAKLADLGSCARLGTRKKEKKKPYDLYSPEPQYVNIEDTRVSATQENEPLISRHPSETYLATNAVSKEAKTYRESSHYRWHAPELFEPDEQGLVHPCAKSDVYSLCLILWESCNASLPWKSLSYEKLKEMYTLWNSGIRLPHDGTYPGCLLDLMQSGLKLARSDRIDLTTLQSTLVNVKRKLDELEVIIIPARLSKKKSNFSSPAWDTNSPTDESDCLSPQSIQHRAVVHKGRESSESSEKETKSDASPFYETIRKEKYSTTFSVPEKCYVSDDENSERILLKYDHLPTKDYSSACSTPIAKIRARIKEMETPGALYRSDSTEYCSFFSPDKRNFTVNNTDQSAECPTAKLSRSFTPKSYKPLHIKVPEFNLDSVKSILKDQSGPEQSSYTFDIKNYSLPNTPIARSNKLRKNAWLSGDISMSQRSAEKLKDISKTSNAEEFSKVQSAPGTPAAFNNSPEKEQQTESPDSNQYGTEGRSPESADMGRDSYTGLRRVEQPPDFSPGTDDEARKSTNSWSCKSSLDRPNKYKVEEEVLARVNVKPLVAIHERWIYEANRKTGRSMSLPEDNRSQTSAVKPASHCVDPLQKSLPQLNLKRGAKCYRSHPVSPSGSGKNGYQWEQFCQAREAVARTMNFGARDPEKFHLRRKDSEKSTTTDELSHGELKTDQATDTKGVEEFIRDLIRKEFQHLLHEISDDASSSSAPRNEELLNKGVANIMENLKNGDDGEHAEPTLTKDPIKSFSRVKINGNNKPLLQITFSRSGENSLQVLDNCVNVTICDNSGNGREKLNISLEDTLTGEDVQVQSLKRCQAFNAIQEARSTEDLYIDDELSTHIQENFGRVKLIPLHGSLHEILCEKEDDCCLIKVKQENGCDTIYFRCDNSDTESKDAIDGCPHDNKPQDTVVFKRSISLIEERIQRIFPKDKRAPTPIVCLKTRPEPIPKTRPKSEVFNQTISQESRAMSISSPSLMMKDKTDEVEINIENAMCYQDSSSDECVKCQTEGDDFELLEQKIEEDLANSNISSLTCGCLEKISEENLSVLNEEVTEKD